MKKLISSFFLLFACTVGSFAQNELLPDVNVTTLEGQKVSIREYIKPGQITFISFWATWCSPCKKELENIMDLYPEWKEKYNVEVIAVSIDDSRTASKVSPYIKAKKWPYKVVLDGNEDLKRALNVQAVPYAFLLDQNGKIVYSHNGYVEGDEFELEEKIKALMGK